MSTTKKRINISLAPESERLLARIAKRDNVPEATKAAALLDLALEIEEDDALGLLANARDMKDTKYFSHADAWK